VKLTLALPCGLGYCVCPNRLVTGARWYTVTRSTSGWWPAEGEEPDPRWSLANERTLLAYERTALGLVVAGIAVVGSHTVADTPAWLAIIGVPLLVLGAAVALEGRKRFLDTQRAMRMGKPLHPPRAATFLPWGIGGVAALAFIVAAVQLVAS
jgi:putative membrane protein